MHTVSFDSKALIMAIEIKRNAENLSLNAVAKASGISKATMSRIARGYKPDVDTLVKLIVWCGVDFNHLIIRV